MTTAIPVVFSEGQARGSFPLPLIAVVALLNTESIMFSSPRRVLVGAKRSDRNVGLAAANLVKRVIE